jgi:hypothetical protein
MSPKSTFSLLPYLLSIVLLGAVFTLYIGGEVESWMPSPMTEKTNEVQAPDAVALDSQIDTHALDALPRDVVDRTGIKNGVAFAGVLTGLGKPKFSVQAEMARLAFLAHEHKLKTPYNLGSYGCAAAIWEYVTKPALKKAYPEQAQRIPSAITHTQTYLNFYKSYKLGRLTTVQATDLTADKTPPGTVLIGIKKGTGDHHMLVAVDVEWGTVTNKATGESVRVAKDGLTDAYAGNTGLPEFGKPHFRIQEFAEHLGFLNTHHGAINSGSENNYYDKFIVMTFAP